MLSGSLPACQWWRWWRRRYFGFPAEECWLPRWPSLSYTGAEGFSPGTSAPRRLLQAFQSPWGNFSAANSSDEDGCAEIQKGVWREASFFHKVEDAYFFLKPRRKIPALCLKIIILWIEVNLRFSFFLQENVRDGGRKVSPIRSIARRSSSRWPQTVLAVQY